MKRALFILIPTQLLITKLLSITMRKTALSVRVLREATTQNRRPDIEALCEKL